MLLAIDKTKISMSLFTIKKKHAVACRPRVSTSHFNKCTVRDVATLTNIPNSDRGRHIGSIKPYNNTPFKFFGSTFLERKVEKTRPYPKLTT